MSNDHPSLLTKQELVVALMPLKIGLLFVGLSVYLLAIIVCIL